MNSGLRTLTLVSISPVMRYQFYTANACTPHSFRKSVCTIYVPNVELNIWHTSFLPLAWCSLLSTDCNVSILERHGRGYYHYHQTTTDKPSTCNTGFVILKKRSQIFDFQTFKPYFLNFFLFTQKHRIFMRCFRLHLFWRHRLAEAVGFEPTGRFTGQTISSRSRYDHFDTPPCRKYSVFGADNLISSQPRYDHFDTAAHSIHRKELRRIGGQSTLLKRGLLRIPDTQRKIKSFR